MKKRAGRVLPLVLFMLLAGRAAAFAQPWRLFAGSFETNWSILGPPGHTEDCRTRHCDDRDLARGNLDRSIGYRLGAERSVTRRGRWELFLGGELGVVFSEYNSSQRDIRIGEAMLVGGGRADLGFVAVLGRFGGGGGAFDDGRADLAHFFEAAIDLPLGKAALRLAARTANHAGPRSTDYSVLLVDLGERSRGDRVWWLGWSFGISDPGRGAGDSLSLSAAPYSSFSIHRAVGAGKDHLGFLVRSSAHESEAKTEYFGVSGNERSQTIHSAAVTWHREHRASVAAGLRYGLGLEVGNWEDEHSLLLDGSGDSLSMGFEAGLLGQIDGILDVAPGVRLLLGIEKTYWRSFGLGELRLRAGFEISP